MFRHARELVLTAALLGGSSLGLAACGSSQTYHTPAGTIHVHKNSRKVTITTPQGTETFSNAPSGSAISVPPQFPKSSVPLPTGGKLIHVLTTNVPGHGTEFDLVYTFGSPNSEVTSYSSQLEAAGFKEAFTSSGSSGDVAAFSSPTWVVDMTTSGKHHLTLMVSSKSTSSSSGS
jgi:hypothetical protein